MDRKRILTERELLEELEKGLSDIEGLDSEDSDEDIIIPREIGDPLPDDIEEDTEENFEQPDEDQDIIEERMIDDEQPMPNSRNYEDTLRNISISKKIEIEWMQGVKFQTRCMFLKDQSVQNLSLENEISPIEYFMKYFPENLFEKMVECTNIYALQNNDMHFPPTNVKELKAFFGLHIITGCLKFPRLSMYWNKSLKVQIFHETMSINRFYKLRTNLHCVNNLDDQNQNDKLWKVRPIFDSVLSRCKELDVEKNVCVDEQMVPFKGHSNIKQYIKNKPHPWGFKLFLLCGASGLTYNFIIYQGNTTEINPQLSKKFGQGAAIVLQLSEVLAPRKHTLFCDNYFTSYNLIEVLNQKSIFVTGTVRLNRFSKPPLTNDKDFRKKQRGYSEEVISNGGVVLVNWLDNKPVTLASNYVGIGDQDNVKRWNKNTKSRIEVKRPQIVKEYNTSMGGVDKADALISLYRTKIRSKKWTLRMIFHAVDMALINSWTEYRKDSQLLGRPAKNTLDLLHFRMEIGEVLIKQGNEISRRKVGRPSKDDVPVQPSRKTTEVRPLADVQFDNVNHMPEHTEVSLPGRCKNVGCKGKSRWICIKCKVHLCLQKNRNCFTNFHKN